ncbi:quinol:cytochrome c oxidoreductase monoheme cytochrome subunit [Flavobacteriaceae bacterium MAR_2010_188]|nr:quinol:cytochrome c oxidoreductase monoheme cytochrome subunit [Flavobacteriaceae bacterium MAR_2010_188]
MRSLIKFVAIVLMFGFVVSCQKDSRPNYQFMPNMYEPVGYETYGSYDVFPDTQEAMVPAAGTVPRGSTLYDYENTNEGYELATTNLKNPLDSTDLGNIKTIALYDIYCAVCHGKNGDGKGILVSREKILGVPAYNDPGRVLTEGSIYHVIMYGKNAMGSYANQLNEKERWQVVDYVLKLKSELGGGAATTDTTATATNATAMAENPTGAASN